MSIRDELLSQALRTMAQSTDHHIRDVSAHLSTRLSSELEQAEASAERELERAKAKPLPYLISAGVGFLAGLTLGILG